MALQETQSDIALTLFIAIVDKELLKYEVENIRRLFIIFIYCKFITVDD